VEYEFSLKFRVVQSRLAPEILVERLAAGGCDDALVGTGRPGRLGMLFTRQASSAEEAVASAIRDVRAAVPEAELEEVGPDFVGLTDLAEIIGISRQAVRKLWLTQQYRFPAPVHDGNPAIWHLACLLSWMRARRYRDIDPRLMEVARVAMRLNVERESAAMALLES
jgi:hypothetical protein